MKAHQKQWPRHPTPLGRRSLVLFLLLAMVGCAGSAFGQASPGRVSLVVVADDNYPPYIFRDSEGELRGILPDQWALWGQKTGVKAELNGMDWGEAQRLMKDGQADVIDTMFFTRERGKLFDFTPAYAQIEVPIYAHKTLGGIGDISSLKGFTIGVKAGDAVIDYLAQRGIDSLKEYPSYEAIILAAKNQELKVFTVDKPAAVYFLYKHGIASEFRESFVLYTGEFHRAVRKNHADILSLVQGGFGMISRSEYRIIDQKWLGSPFLLKEILRHWGPWILGVLVAVLVLALGNVFLGHRVSRKTAELRAALEDLRQSLVEREAVDAALKENHEIFQLFMSHSPIYAFIKEVTSTESRVLIASENYQHMIGIPGSAMLGKTMEELFPPEFAVKITADDWTVVTKGEVLKLEEELNGRHYTTIKFPIVLGGKRLLAGYTIDNTERVNAENEKEALQAQLAQMQKLESIGRLAGGVAHDFNNMLQAILGYTEIALEQVSSENSLQTDLLEIKKTAQRAASLTRQLQVFARHQVMEPKVIAINESVDSMLAMLRRLIGEEIRLAWNPGSNLGRVKIDPSQLDQIVVNLCLNARDAIGKSGHITIETANAKIARSAGRRPDDLLPGAYVLLSVSDDGSGITPDVREHIFEPFFTTKPLGKGTGLGLSTVYGIVKQNGGAVTVVSEPGTDTVFRIYLPRHDEAGQMAALPVETEAPSDPKNKTILLVDDEKMILLPTCRILESLGYRVFATDSAQEALRLFEEHQDRIDLLITDVIMPEINGPDLARALLAKKPKLRYLFISGYAANRVTEQGFDETRDFIQKPFSRNVLAQKVVEILGG